MIKDFIYQCLLFQSGESLHRVFGVAGWISIVLFVYAAVQLTIIYS